MTVLMDLQHAVEDRRVSQAALDLDELSVVRLVVRAHAAGEDQKQIARSLGVSQPAVSKILKRARLLPETVGRSPREVILEYAAGRATARQMLDELLAWPYTDGAVQDSTSVEPETYVRGTFDQVVDAARAGLITGEQYERIVRCRHQSHLPIRVL